MQWTQGFHDGRASTRTCERVLKKLEAELDHPHWHWLLLTCGDWSASKKRELLTKANWVMTVLAFKEMSAAAEKKRVRPT